MESNDELDRMIDGALRGYSGAEPLAGLEERVLNRVRAAEAERRPGLRLWRWVLAGAVPAALVLGIVFWPGQSKAPKTGEVARARIVPPAPNLVSPVNAPPVRPRLRARVRRTTRPPSLPKLEQFPAPAPLTAEERALLAFVERDPKQAQQAFAELEKRNAGPIEIQPIQIPPLQMDGAQ